MLDAGNGKTCSVGVGVRRAAPGWGAGEVEVAGARLAVDGGERGVEPATGTGERPRQVVAAEEADLARLERMALQLAAEHGAVEHDRVHRQPREPEAQAVEAGDQRPDLDLDTGFLVHL